MHDYQRDFIELTLARDVLRFGEFTLKSGRSSPYFFNMGRIDSGAALAQLGRAYADAVVNSGIAIDMLFGPAYKGIALAAATAIALADRHGRDLPWAYNRKEAKDHGEGRHAGRRAAQGARADRRRRDDRRHRGARIARADPRARRRTGRRADRARPRRSAGRERSATQESRGVRRSRSIAIARLSDLLAYAADKRRAGRDTPR